MKKMIRNNPRIFFAFTVTVIHFISISSWAQKNLDPPVLRQYLLMAADSNFSIQQKKSEWKKSKAIQREALGRYFPSLSLEARYTRAGGGRTIDLPIGDLLNPVYQILNQDLPAEQQIGLVENQEIHFIRPHEQQSYLRLVVPIIQPQIWFGHRASKKMAKSTHKAFKKEIRDIFQSVRKAYYRYIQSLEASIQSVPLQQMMQGLFETNQPVEVWEEKALKISEERKQITTIIKALESKKKVELSQAMPTLNGIVDAGIQGEEFAFEKENRYYTASAVLSWNIFSGGTTLAKKSQIEHEIRKARQGLKQLRESIKFRVRKAYRELKSAKSGLLPAREKVKAATENLRKIRGLLNAGSASPSDLIEAQSQKAMAEAGEKLAMSEVLIASAHLRRLTEPETFLLTKAEE